VGVSILFISHRLEELAGFADRITILRDGARVVTDEMQRLSQPEIVHYMVGRSESELIGEERRFMPAILSRPLQGAIVGNALVDAIPIIPSAAFITQ
jgi:ABC-type sugar transport system ATPase subunit